MQLNLYSGNGTAYSASSTNAAGASVTVNAEYSDALPFTQMDLVDCDGETYDNIGSAYLHVLERMHETDGVDGSGVYLSGYDHQFVDSGSFTIEATMKLDYATWKQKLKTQFMRYTIFGLYGNATYPFEFHLSAIWDGDDYFRLTGYAYTPTGHVATKICNYNGDPGARTGADINFLKDNAWHHFALVYDDPTHTFKLYVDYEIKDSRVFPEAFRPTFTSQSTRQYWFGGNKMNHSGFEGWFDEARLLRTALEPEDFIRFRRSGSPRRFILICR